MKILTKEKLRKMTEDNEEFVLVNVLMKRHFEDGHIRSSINIPVDEIPERAEKEISDRDAKVVVYCASFECQASMDAVKMLEKMGYTNVYDYSGGIKDWKDAGYALGGGV